jgi:hypothetical protein
LAYLENEGLNALHRLAAGESSFKSFRQTALAEPAVRVEAAIAARLATEEEKLARKADLQEKARLGFERANAARLARESDPRYIAKVKQQALRARYGIDGYIEQDCFGRLMQILKRVDAGQRLSEQDFTWVSSAGEEHFTEARRQAPVVPAAHRSERYDAGTLACIDMPETCPPPLPVARLCRVNELGCANDPLAEDVCRELPDELAEMICWSTSAALAPAGGMTPRNRESMR